MNMLSQKEASTQTRTSFRKEKHLNCVGFSPRSSPTLEATTALLEIQVPGVRDPTDITQPLHLRIRTRVAEATATRPENADEDGR